MSLLFFIRFIFELMTISRGVSTWDTVLWPLSALTEIDEQKGDFDNM